ncbi:MAG: ribosome maturation protein RimP [Novosphingobium sp.]
MADIAALTTIVEPEAQALGFALVRVALFGAGEERTLQVMAERPESRQLTIDDCAELSRRISDRLDALEAEGRDPIDGPYRLEVSSPGIDRPLTRLADFADWAGHEAKVQLANPIEGRKSLHGALAGVEIGTIALDDRKSGPVRFRLEDVASAKLVLTDKLIAATRPLDTAGVEEEDLADAKDDDAHLGLSEDDHIEDELLSKEQDA